MSIQFICPGCATRLSIASRKAGAETPCPTCRTLLRVPEGNPLDAGSAAGLRRGKRIFWLCIVGVILFILGGATGWLLRHWNAFGVGKEEEVWVGEIDRTKGRAGGAGVQRSYSSDGGKGIWIDAFDLDGNSVGALVEDKSQREAVEAELEKHKESVPSAGDKVSAGWIIPGSTATRVVDRLGRGVQAAKFRFSSEAIRVRVEPEVIRERGKRKP